MFSIVLFLVMILLMCWMLVSVEIYLFLGKLIVEFLCFYLLVGRVYEWWEMVLMLYMFLLSVFVYLVCRLLLLLVMMMGWLFGGVFRKLVIWWNWLV